MGGENEMFEEPELLWFDAIPELEYKEKHRPSKSAESTAKQLRLKERGQSLLEQLASNAKDRSLSSDEKWMQKISSRGTTSDKLAAGLLLIKEHPPSQLKTLQGLIAQAKKKGGKSNVVVIESLKDLFLESLLPSDRPLKNFRDQAWFAKKVTDKHLLYWAFEEEMKLCYASFIQCLEQCARDTVEHLRDVAIKIMASLLSQHPEQEQMLLTQLVNKMGDPVRKVASTSVTCLLNVLEEHPNITEKAVYYALIFLNQVILTTKEENVSLKLTEIYFTVFRRYMEDTSTLVQTRILTAILTGLNRSYPFISAKKQEDFTAQTDVLYKIVHTSAFNRSTQTLMLLFQMHASTDVPDRYYRALYDRLLAPDLHHASKVSMFLNLLFRSVNRDGNITRVNAFLKRVLQICSHSKPSLICGMLYLVSEVIKNRPKLRTCIQQPEEASLVATENGEDSYYNGQMREPQFSRAEESCLWEINELCHHFHPSVCSFAETLREGGVVTYQGDPLLDFGSIAFLDKFAFKNPRAKERLKGGSIMQNLHERKSVTPLNTAKFIDLPEEQVDEEHKFFHHYFQVKRASKKNSGKEENQVTTFDSDSDEDEDPFDSNPLDGDAADLLAAEEAALGGGGYDDSSDEEGDGPGGAPEFDYDDMDEDDFFDEDDETLDPNEPTEEQLEAMLLEGEDMSESESDFEDDGEPSAFAAAEEYAKLLEDDVDEQVVQAFREQRGMKNKAKGKGKGKAKGSFGSSTGKRKRPPPRKDAPKNQG